MFLPNESQGGNAIMRAIRKATSQDIELIRQLALEVFPATYKNILTVEQIAYMLDWMYSSESLYQQMTEKNHSYFIGYKGDSPFGYASIEQKEEDVFCLQKIYILPSFQGEHLGSYLFQELINYIKKVHLTEFTLELNVNKNNPALKFYERMGMKKVGERKAPIGNDFYMDDYIMAIRVIP